MRSKRRIVFLALVVVAATIGATLMRGRDSRLSAVVAVVSKGPAIEAFLAKPSVSFVQTYVRFDPDLPDDILFGIDQEFADGVAHPTFVKGGDWMAFIAIQRTGAVWVATGTDATMSGHPSRDRTWKIFDLKQRLQPSQWYRIRTEADFAKRHFVSFSIDGPDMKQTLDLRQLTLDYPNYIPFSDRAMTYYVAAMRGRGMAKQNGKPIVYFDDVTGAVRSGQGTDTVVFKSSFEETGVIPEQPITSPIIDITRYEPQKWYLERSESIVTARKVPFAHSGRQVGVADVNLN